MKYSWFICFRESSFHCYSHSFGFRKTWVFIWKYDLWLKYTLPGQDQQFTYASSKNMWKGFWYALYKFQLCWFFCLWTVRKGRRNMILTSSFSVSNYILTSIFSFYLCSKKNFCLPIVDFFISFYFLWNFMNLTTMKIAIKSMLIVMSTDFSSQWLHWSNFWLFRVHISALIQEGACPQP